MPSTSCIMSQAGSWVSYLVQGELSILSIPKPLFCFFVLPNVHVGSFVTAPAFLWFSQSMKANHCQTAASEDRTEQSPSVPQSICCPSLSSAWESLFCGFGYLPLQNRIHVVAESSAEQKWDALVLSAIPSFSLADPDGSTFCSFLPHYVISSMDVSFTLHCVRISRTGTSPGLIHLKLLTWEKWLFGKKKKITGYNTGFLPVGPVVLNKAGQGDHHTSDEEVEAKRHKVINPRSYSG